MAHTIYVSLLGGFQIHISGDGSGGLPSGGKVSALFAYLAYDDRPHPRDVLANLLWEDRGEDQARSSLRQALTAMRQLLPAGTVEADRDWVQLNNVASDVAAFTAGLAQGDARGLTHAMGLYRGDLLEGFHVRANAFEHWLAAERQIIQTRAVDAVVALLEATDDGAVADLHVPGALRILAQDNTHEPLHRALMRHYATHGQSEAALRQYFHCRDALGRELGATPEPETEDLYQHILRQDGARRMVG